MSAASGTTSQEGPSRPRLWTTGELLALDERHRAGASIGLLATIECRTVDQMRYLLRQARRIRLARRVPTVTTT